MLIAPIPEDVTSVSIELVKKISVETYLSSEREPDTDCRYHRKRPARWLRLREACPGEVIQADLAEVFIRDPGLKIYVLVVFFLPDGRRARMFGLLPKGTRLNLPEAELID